MLPNVKLRIRPKLTSRPNVAQKLNALLAAVISLRFLHCVTISLTDLALHHVVVARAIEKDRFLLIIRVK